MSDEQKTATSPSSPYSSVPYNETQSVAIDQLVSALTLAQKDLKAVDRNRGVTVDTRAGGSYSFKYATLDHVIEHVRPALTANNLWFAQLMRQGHDGSFVLETRLMHNSGQWIASQTPLIVDQHAGNQQFGSSLTFMRRYALTSLLGIAAEDDDDANAADGNAIAKVEDRKPKAPKEDVISTGGGTAIKPPSGPPRRLPVGELTDGALDWVNWGKTIIAEMRNSQTSESVLVWEKINEKELNDMMNSAPTL